MDICEQCGVVAEFVVPLRAERARQQKRAADTMYSELEAGRPVSSLADESETLVPQQLSIPTHQSVPASQGPLSPTLLPWKRGDASAYELKFVLDEAQACQVEALLAQQLVRDPFSLPELGSAYRIHTVYCDTPEFDVFYAVGNYRRRKYRLRSYGSQSQVFLERKTKVGQRVRKKRTTVAPGDLATLSGFQPRDGWSGDWFHRQLLQRRLNPVCCVSYLRTAYIGTGDEGPIRLTFDRNLSGFASRTWMPVAAAESFSFLEGRVVCEFKFRGTMPALFKSTIQALHLSPCGNSKYRHCLHAAQVPTSPGLPAAASSNRDVPHA